MVTQDTTGTMGKTLAAPERWTNETKKKVMELAHQFNNGVNVQFRIFVNVGTVKAMKVHYDSTTEECTFTEELQEQVNESDLMNINSISSAPRKETDLPIEVKEQVKESYLQNSDSINNTPRKETELHKSDCITLLANLNHDTNKVTEQAKESELHNSDSSNGNIKEEVKETDLVNYVRYVRSEGEQKFIESLVDKGSDVVNGQECYPISGKQLDQENQSTPLDLTVKSSVPRHRKSGQAHPQKRHGAAYKIDESRYREVNQCDQKDCLKEISGGFFGLQHHVRTSHKRELCHICLKSILGRSNMSRHINTHEDKKHKCSQCPKAFTRSNDLKNHVKTHVKKHDGLELQQEKKTEDASTKHQDKSQSSHEASDPNDPNPIPTSLDERTTDAKKSLDITLQLQPQQRMRELYGLEQHQHSFNPLNHGNTQENMTLPDKVLRPLSFWCDETSREATSPPQTTSPPQATSTPHQATRKRKRKNNNPMRTPLQQDQPIDEDEDDFPYKRPNHSLVEHPNPRENADALMSSYSSQILQDSLRQSNEGSDFDGIANHLHSVENCSSQAQVFGHNTSFQSLVSQTPTLGYPYNLLHRPLTNPDFQLSLATTSSAAATFSTSAAVAPVDFQFLSQPVAASSRRAKTNRVTKNGKRNLKRLDTTNNKPLPPMLDLDDDEIDYTCVYEDKKKSILKCQHPIINGFKAYEKHVMDAHGTFACKHCTKTFTGKNNRARHLRNHEKDRTINCLEDKCDKKFSRNDSMREHLYTHTWSYNNDHCLKCGMKFSKKSQGLTHLKRCLKEFKSKDGRIDESSFFLNLAINAPTVPSIKTENNDDSLHTTADDAALHTTANDTALHTTADNAALHTTADDAALHTTADDAALHTTADDAALHTTADDSALHSTAKDYSLQSKAPAAQLTNGIVQNHSILLLNGGEWDTHNLTSNSLLPLDYSLAASSDATTGGDLNGISTDDTSEEEKDKSTNDGSETTGSKEASVVDGASEEEEEVEARLAYDVAVNHASNNNDSDEDKVVSNNNANMPSSNNNEEKLPEVGSDTLESGVLC